MNKLVQELCGTIGTAATIALTRRWQGRSLSIPREIGDLHPIAIAIGHQAAQALAKAYPSQQLMIPAERNVLLDLRNQRICEAYRTGASVSELAREWDISRRMVLKVVDREGLREDK